jgi:hypothetical protein
MKYGWLRTPIEPLVAFCRENHNAESHIHRRSITETQRMVIALAHGQRGRNEGSCFKQTVFYADLATESERWRKHICRLRQGVG